MESCRHLVDLRRILRAVSNMAAGLRLSEDCGVYRRNHEGEYFVLGVAAPVRLCRRISLRHIGGGIVPGIVECCGQSAATALVTQRSEAIAIVISGLSHS